LPIDAHLAGFSVAGDPARAAGLARTLSELADAALGSLEVPERSRRPWLDLIEAATSDAGIRVIATGRHATAARAGGDASVADIPGWMVLGFGTESRKVLEIMRAAARGLSDKESRGPLGEALTLVGMESDAVPTLTERAPRAKFAPGTRVFVVALPAPWAALAADSPRFGQLHRDSSAGAPIDVIVAVVPAADFTWLGWDTDEQRLSQRLAVVLKGSDQTLAGRAGLGPLREGRLNDGGFLTLRALGASPLAGAIEARAFDQLPNGGDSPILVTWSVVEQGPSMRLVVALPGAALRDIAALLR
jgi:hypothetical protein